MRDLLAHCNLPFEDACLRFHETERGILTPSAEQVRQPLYNDALEQWRHYDSLAGPIEGVARRRPGLVSRGAEFRRAFAGLPGSMEHAEPAALAQFAVTAASGEELIQRLDLP